MRWILNNRRMWNRSGSAPDYRPDSQVAAPDPGFVSSSTNMFACKVVLDKGVKTRNLLKVVFNTEAGRRGAISR